jgi:hypothetical protein
MAQSRLSAENDQAIGTRAGDLGAWDKLQLGWLDYEIVLAGQTRALDLGPHEYNSAKPQGVVVVLPKKNVLTQLGAPYEGTHQWWSGSGDDLDNSMSRQVTLPAGSSQLSFQARWDIEDCGPDPCDYAYVEVQDGSTWTAIPGSITKAAEGNGIDGVQATWTNATFDLSAYAGKTVGLRIRYVTDGAAQGNDVNLPNGIFVDDLKITSGATGRLRRRCREWCQRVDAGRVHHPGRQLHHPIRQLLHRVEPGVRQVRPVPEDRPVQLRLHQHQAGLGRALPLPGRAAHLLLGHLAAEQRRGAPPGSG